VQDDLAFLNAAVSTIPDLSEFEQLGPTASLGVVYKENFVRPTISASNIFGGTATEPQRIGKQFHVQYFTGDGTTDTFNVTAPFTINELSPARTVQAAGYRASDGVPLVYTVDNITGFGTNTISVRVRFSGSAPPAGAFIAVSVRGAEDDGASAPTLISTTGYNNLVNPIMSLAFGAHGIIGNGLGHNGFLWGAYGNVFGGYSVAGGQHLWVGSRNPSGTVGAGAFGRGMRIDGSTTFAFGIGHDINGLSCFASGEQHQSAQNYTTLQGRRALAFSQGERILAGGKVNDTVNGLYQVRELVFGGNTTNNTITGISNVGNVLTQAMPARSAAMLRVEVSAIKDDFAKMQCFAGDFLLTVDGDGTARVNNSVADVVIPSIFDIGSPGYAAAARAISGGLQIRVTGATGENVRWAAYARLTQTMYPA
jgi:hypothetical protein